MLKPTSFRGRSPRPLPGDGVSGGQCMDENLLWNYIKSKLIRLQFNIITNMLRHIIKKKYEIEDMIKTEARKTWSDHVNFALRNVKQVFLDFKSATTRELPGRSPKADHWTSPVLGFHGKPLVGRAIARYSLFRYSGEMEMYWPPHSQHPAHATAPMQHKPGRLILSAGNMEPLRTFI